MSAPPDREQLKRDLSEALSAIQQDQGALGPDELAAALTTLGPRGAVSFYACVRAAARRRRATRRRSRRAANRATASRATWTT
jgi:hypothetical protein